ncbi:hypothetical protein ONS95_005609 [Cadophora gregata]|uniref:uncharacterized protein n=1 Tax=Cadophora gregata TaxID=51156 RepID=UPI0026DCDA03|nr:uncharacterized protein ONS95_005609 [Cadophora gregata]KAK0103597.1 hypothetical protein ONS95_005609 [Cadophora gregata]
MSQSLLITFYEEAQPDHRGRYLSGILNWNANKLESAHDYIQIVFPLPEESGVQWNAPTINRPVFDAFRTRPELRERMKDSFKKMMWFYGFVLVETDDSIRVHKGANWNNHSGHWDVRFDHNHLRITRIIRCLRVLGLEDEAQAFYDALEQNALRVSARSREYWRRAARRTLNLRPDLEDRQIDGDDDLSVGPKFLREFEELQRHIAESKKADDSISGTVGIGIGALGETAEKEYPVEEQNGTGLVGMEGADLKGTNTKEPAVKHASRVGTEGNEASPKVGNEMEGPKLDGTGPQ